MVPHWQLLLRVVLLVMVQAFMAQVEVEVMLEPQVVNGSVSPERHFDASLKGRVISVEEVKDDRITHDSFNKAILY
jgi:hypothetical protein